MGVLLEGLGELGWGQYLMCAVRLPSRPNRAQNKRKHVQSAESQVGDAYAVQLDSEPK